MQISLNDNLESLSAAPKKVATFIEQVFKLKAPVAKKMADALSDLSKEKVVASTAIDNFLAYAKGATADDIAKAQKSKTVQNLKPVLASIVKNTTFKGTLEAIKKFKFNAKVSTKTPKERVTEPTKIKKPKTSMVPGSNAALESAVIEAYTDMMDEPPSSYADNLMKKVRAIFKINTSNDMFKKGALNSATTRQLNKALDLLEGE